MPSSVPAGAGVDVAGASTPRGLELGRPSGRGAVVALVPTPMVLMAPLNTTVGGATTPGGLVHVELLLSVADADTGVPTP